MTAMQPQPTTTTLPNPFVGPRSYTAKDPGEGRNLYGRDRELQELLQLMIAERIVLLFSPSGAGKSSLINAALLPALRKADFTVLPVMRVAHEPPDPGLRKMLGFNRYVLSALMSLERGRPEREQREAGELVGISLADYLKSAPAMVAAALGRQQQRQGEDKPLALIFDQFEEILTLDPTDIEAKREFFTQVGEALRLPQHWALFSMREDYVASLDPFVRLIPTALTSTYRLDLLGVAAARSAIRKPASDRGVDFTTEAARTLINDLRAVYVQQLSGRATKQLGPHVDPVHLQVVCYRLWEKLPVTPATKSIGEGDLKKGGDVNDALAGYYADSIAAVALKGYASERHIRDWVDNHLITEQGVRGQILRGEGHSQELDNRVIDELIAAHLLRREERRGATWIELAHDRLVEPVRADNLKYQSTLSHLQRQARVWQQRDRPEWLLLRGDELTKANEWARNHQGELTEVEQEYRKASNRQRARAAAFGVMGLLCLALMIVAVILWRNAVKAKAAAIEAQEAAVKAERAAIEARKEAEKLKEQYAGVILEEFDVDKGLAGQVDDQKLKQIIEFSGEYKKLADATPAANRSSIRIKYHHKPGDPPEVVAALRGLGFEVVLEPALNDTPTNYVRYGPLVDIKDVKLTTLALLRAGVPLKLVNCFSRPSNLKYPDGKANVIEIGAWQGHEANNPVTIADVNQLKPCPRVESEAVPAYEEP
jgi:hypothetical protein